MSLYPADKIDVARMELRMINYDGWTVPHDHPLGGIGCSVGCHGKHAVIDLRVAAADLVAQQQRRLQKVA